MPVATSSRQHLDWSASEALKLYDQGDKQGAITCFIEKVAEHPGTAWIDGHPSTMMLLNMGAQQGRYRFESAMRGFAADDTVPTTEQEQAMASQKTAPRNTTEDMGAEEVLFAALAGSSTEDAILAQEASGQRSLINSDTLPAQHSAEDRRVLEAAGVVFGEQVPGDDLFVYVTLPEGWKKVATDHSMHSDLVDDKGRRRAGIFYKAAFYDRSAHLTINRRFGVRQDYKRADDDQVIVYYVTDGNDKVFTTPEHSFTGERYGEDSRAKEKLASSEAQAWLSEHYPDWENAAAYWD